MNANIIMKIVSVFGVIIFIILVIVFLKHISVQKEVISSNNCSTHEVKKNNNIVTDKKIMDNSEPEYYANQRELNDEMRIYIEKKMEDYDVMKDKWPLHGIYFNNGKPAFLHPYLMQIPGYSLTDDSLKNIQNSKKIKAGFLDFEFNAEGIIIIVLRDIYNNKLKITNEEKVVKLFYQIENYKMYVSINEKNWDRLYISNVRLNVKNSEFRTKFNLTCKYFEGEYGVLKHP